MADYIRRANRAQFRSLIVAEQLPLQLGERQRHRDGGRCGMEPWANSKWPPAGQLGNTKCTNRIMAAPAFWPLSNCQLAIAVGSVETIDGSIVRSLSRCIPCSLLPALSSLPHLLLLLPGLQRFGPRFADIVLQTT